MKIKKKTCICILLFLMFIICNGSMVYAASSVDVLKSTIDILLKLFGSVVGVFTWPFKLMVLAVSVAIQGVMSALAHLGGGSEDIFVTPFSILFNKVEATSIDFFDFSSTTDFILKFRQNIAMWYYVLRFIAASILLAILVYIGIRMVISTVADEKAKYKKMIVDWLVSLALLYLLHYIIVFVISINTAFVDMLAQTADDIDMGWILAGLLATSVSPVTGIGGWAATILYVVFIWQTLKFFIMYVKRMITIGFLILISPLITITYSVDRAGDQKAQALNTWLKEFIYNVLIQPFHCILYLSFAYAAFSTIVNSETDSVIEVLGGAIFDWSGGLNGVGNLFFAVLCLVFVNSGEKIIREIFGFNKASTVGDLVGAAAVATTAFKSANSLGEAAKKSGGVGKVLFPGMGSVKDKIANTNIGQKLANSETGKFLAGASSTLRTGVHNVGESIRFGAKDGDPGVSLNDVIGNSTQKVANFATSAATTAKETFTRSVDSLKSRIDDFKGKHPVATEIFGVGKKGVIAGAKSVKKAFSDTDNWKAVGLVQGAGLGLGMEGSLFQTALYATAFSKLGEYIGKRSGITENRTATELAKDVGKSVRAIETINKTEMTEEEFIEHIKTIEVVGSTGQYTPEKIGEARNRFFTVIQKSSADGPISQDHLARGFMAMHNTFVNGGDELQAAAALLTELEKHGHHIKPEKKVQIIKMVKDLETQTVNGQIYRSWEEAQKQNVSIETFAKAILNNKAEKVPGGETAPETATAYNEVQNTASGATSELDALRKTLAAGEKPGATPATVDADALMKILEKMAQQIIAYQASDHVNEVVLKEMVNTYNITATRTDNLELEFTKSKIENLEPVKKFKQDGTNPGKYKLEDTKTTS